MMTTDSPAPNPKSSMSRFITIFVFLLALFILFDQNIRSLLGSAVGFVFEPIIGFNGLYPVVTLFFAGALMTLFTTVLRHFFTDYVGQVRSQKVVSAFNKELRQARTENNKFKLKKLLDMQPQIMQKSMDASSTQMKLMPITMLVVIPIFAWLAVFMWGMSGEPSSFINVPWSSGVNLNDAYVLPNWILLYSLISIPFGQLLQRTLRYFNFRKRLRELGEAPA